MLSSAARGTGMIRDGHPLGCEPGGDLGGVEPEEVAPLEERNPSLADKPADVADGHAEVIGDLLDGQEPRQLIRRESPCSSGVIRHRADSLRVTSRITTRPTTRCRSRSRFVAQELVTDPSESARSNGTSVSAQRRAL